MLKHQLTWQGLYLSLSVITILLGCLEYLASYHYLEGSSWILGLDGGGVEYSQSYVCGSH